MRTEDVGRLRVRITGGLDGDGGGEGPVVVLLHGFGAPGDDLVQLWRVFDVPRETRFVFPAGPMALPMGDSRAWWMVDFARRERAVAEGRPSDVTRDTPVGLPEARGHIETLLDWLGAKKGAESPRVVLGGFSQGAMLSCDVAFRTSIPLAGLVLMSGTIVSEDEWTRGMPSRAGLPVVQSHGRMDPLLPFFLAEQLRDRLRSAGLPVQWIEFRGGHTIPGDVIDGVGSFLRKTLYP